jgi:PA14 domain/Ricin-type beta-trefoil lectin domain/Peptidase family M23
MFTKLWSALSKLLIVFVSLAVSLGVAGPAAGAPGIAAAGPQKCAGALFYIPVETTATVQVPYACDRASGGPCPSYNTATGGHPHQGLDIFGVKGVTKVYAAADGTIFGRGTGTLAINVGGKIAIYYTHMGDSKTGQSYILPNFGNGASVKAGDLLGTMGDLGATSTHLHFTIYRYGNREDNFPTTFDPTAFLGLSNLAYHPGWSASPFSCDSNPWTFCANENEACSFSGTMEVRYGLNTAYVSKTVTDGTPCTNAVFGDPMPGSGKQCHYRRTQTPVTCPASFSNWKGEYWNGRDLSGNLTLCRDDANVNFDWGSGGPGGNTGSDNFSARWTRTLNFDSGQYRLHLAGDDGIRLWVDGQLVIDQWKNQPLTESTADVTLSAGSHTLKVEYYDLAGQAAVKLWWEKLVKTTPILESGRAYSLQSANTPQFVLDVYNGNTADGTRIIQWDNHGNSPNQTWIAEAFPSGYYRFHSALNYTKCMVVQYASRNDGGKIILCGCSPHGQDNEWWLPVSMGGSHFYLQNQRSGKVLDVPNASHTQGTQLNQWAYNGSLAQQWIALPK